MISFSPYIRVYVNRQMKTMDIQIDPRLTTTEEYMQQIFSKMSTFLNQIMIRENIYDGIQSVVDSLHEGYHRDEVQSVEFMLHTPQWKHDCDTCVFLANHNDCDLYYHPSESIVLETVIARHGDRGDAYKSGIGFIEHDSDLWAAAVYTQAKGIKTLLENTYTIVMD